MRWVNLQSRKDVRMTFYEHCHDIVITSWPSFKIVLLQLSFSRTFLLSPHQFHSVKVKTHSETCSTDRKVTGTNSFVICKKTLRKTKKFIPFLSAENLFFLSYFLYLEHFRWSHGSSIVIFYHFYCTTTVSCKEERRISLNRVRLRKDSEQKRADSAQTKVPSSPAQMRNA